MDDLVLGTLTPTRSARVLGAAGPRRKLNILISGGTGTGKTTLLNVLSASSPGHERIVTIEDAAELQLQQPHVVRLETRPPNIEGRGEVTQRDLVRNSAAHAPGPHHRRRGPRGRGAGHAAGDEHRPRRLADHGPRQHPRDALTRLESMVAMAGVNLPLFAPIKRVV
jgi:pilus assembly protein CpaF